MADADARLSAIFDRVCPIGVAFYFTCQIGGVLDPSAYVTETSISEAALLQLLIELSKPRITRGADKYNVERITLHIQAFKQPS